MTIPNFVTMPTKANCASPYDKVPKKARDGTKPFGKAVGKKVIPEQ